jgi:hypothetical protein
MKKIKAIRWILGVFLITVFSSLLVGGCGESEEAGTTQEEVKEVVTSPELSDPNVTDIAAVPSPQDTIPTPSDAVSEAAPTEVSDAISPSEEVPVDLAAQEKEAANAVEKALKEAFSGGGDFDLAGVPGTYDASNDKTSVYNIPKIVGDAPAMWASYGDMFKKIGAELGVDPYALASYCVFESYNSNTHNFNPRMKDVAGGMYAAGIGATQAQDVKGQKVPGLEVYYPKSTLEAAEVLRGNPEYSIRSLADEFKRAVAQTNDLAKAFPKVAYPNWKPGTSKGAYGTQAQYVSRAKVFYDAFRSADGK